MNLTRITCATLTLLLSVVIATTQEITPSTRSNGKIAFVGSSNGASRLYLMNPDGSNLTQLLNLPAYVNNPEWSPDGNKIAFSGSPQGYRPQIYVVNADGSNLTNLTNNTTGNFEPSWSPDGTKITFSSHGGSNVTDIYLMNADGSGVTNISNRNNTTSRRPAWRALRLSAPQLPPSSIQFSASGFTAFEGGVVQITVTRLGDISREAAVNYITANETASERTDYITAAGTLRFAANEASKTFNVLITDDVFVEGNETLKLTLIAPTNGDALNSQSTVTLTITDNDFSAPTQNPIDTVSGFVRQQYHDFLNREPDAPGLAFWKQILQSYSDKCGSADNAEANTCRAQARAAVSEAFFVSVEFQQTGYLVYRLYKASFDPTLRPRGLPRYAEFLRDAQAIGSGVIVNSPGWEQKLAANTEAFIKDFVQRSEFTARHPLSMTAEQYVNALLTTAGLAQGGTEKQDALTAYGAGGVEGRAKALRSIAESKRLFLQEFNKAFVLMQYFGYLRRSADEGEDAGRPFAGYDFWLQKLNDESDDTARFTTIDELLEPTKRARMVEAFVVTGEYRRRFGPE